MRAVLVGCGGISKAWLEAASKLDGAQIVGLVDLDLTQAERRAAEFGLDVPLGTDLEAMLSGTAPEAVFDCTVPTAHHGVTVTALRCGCHVLGEKPIADDPDEARASVRAAAASGRVYAVVQNRRFDPNLRRLRTLLDSGALGRVTTVNADFYLGPHFGGFRERMAHPLLKDMAIHTFDAARFLTGADLEAVYCHAWNPAGSWYAHGASAVAVFEMTGGVVFTYRGSWAAEGLPTAWEGAWRIVGERGSVAWDGAEGFRAQVVSQVVSESATESGGFLSTFSDLELPPADNPDMLRGHAGVIQDFVTSLRSGTPPESVCTDNFKSLEMVFGAVRSAEAKRRVEISLNVL